MPRPDQSRNQPLRTDGTLAAKGKEPTIYDHAK
jgi:hypothetical protein